MRYNWQQKDWTKFSYNTEELEDKLYLFAEKTGQVKGISKGLTAPYHTQTLVDILVSEAIKTSEIEGEFLNRKDVMSSVRNNLNLNPKTEKVADLRAKGIGKLVTDVQNSYQPQLTKEMLFNWHKQLLMHDTTVLRGTWRTHQEPMQVVSGAMEKEKIHFEAPASNIVPREMDNFITWFNDSAPNGAKYIKHPPIRSAIAHLYFESIHPFEDGNGRIGRAIAEKALIQSLGNPLLISLSTSIEKNKKQYYNALEKGQRSNEITPWLHFFIDMILDALDTSEAMIHFTLLKTRFFDQFRDILNERQEKVIRRMFKEGLDGFEGGMNARKYTGITKTSKATATRDLQHLLQIGVFESTGKGRNVSYQIHSNVFNDSLLKN